MTNYLYQVNGQTVGSSIYHSPVPYIHPPHALAYLCPNCGEVWARKIPLIEETVQHFSRTIPCPKCGPNSHLVTHQEIKGISHETISADLLVTEFLLRSGNIVQG